MTREPRHRLGWAPVFLVGVVCAVGAEVAMALLLYSGPGFTRSLTTLLTVEALALAVGLKLPVPAPESADGLRRRWMLALISFLAATVFGTVWTLMPEVGTGRWAQGIGLALLAGLPLYACGSLFSGLAAEAEEGRGGFGGAGVAPTAALGAALGFALTGILLPRAPTPSSLLVGCLIFLSLGGMAYSVVRGGQTRRRVIAEGCLGPPSVCVEERVPVGGKYTDWVLLEGSVLRALRRFQPAGEAGEGVAEAAVDAWDLRMLRELAPRRGGWRGLFVGGGASRSPTSALQEAGAGEALVLERTHCVVDLGRSHFDTGMAAGESDEGVAGPGTEDDDASRVADSVPKVVVGNLEDAIRAIEEPFDFILIDGRALDSFGTTATALSGWARAQLGALLSPGGVMMWGPKAAHHPRGYGSPDWVTERRDQREPLEEVLVVRHAVSASAPLEGGPTTS